ncbi:MAG: hypothetical protein Q8N43_01145, partial [Candidatus Azambacteria bacterium]|nr:hypothetical protein [Candidatus Azambacteria bacterium]
PWPWNTINCSVSKPSLHFQPPPGATTTLDIINTNQTVDWGSKLGEEVARNQLQQAGITINHTNPCPIGVGYQDVPGGCTSLDGVKKSTIEKAIQLKNKCQCALEVSGGTELGHTEGDTSHASGNKLDFISNSVLEQYIVNNFTYSGLRTGGAKLYKAPDGSIYARELTHWDVTFTGL